MTTETITPKIDRAEVGGVPEELLDNRWVNWRYEWRQNHRGEWKLTKVPRTSEGMAASHSDPQTWRSWEQVFDYAIESGGALGIGRVLSAYDPYFMVDLDDCYDYKTGQVKDWAQPWVKFAEAYRLYIEVSPSKTGLKIIGKGTLPGSGRRKKIFDADGEKIGEIELYDRLRFTTITGDNFGSLDTVGDGQDLVDRLHADVFGPERQANDPGDWPGSLWSDDEVIEHACKSEKFRKAWRGDYSDFDNDGSRGDFYTAWAISKYSRDPHQTERIMRNNPSLYRDKWDTHATYLFERTILGSKPADDEFEDKARLITPLDKVSPSPSLKDSDTSDTSTTTLEYPPIVVVDVGQSTRPQGSQPFLVADVMPKNYPTVFFGDSGTVKSTLAGHLAQCVARGIPWMGHQTKQTNVLTLDFELDTDTHNRRAHDTAKGMGFTEPAPGTFYIECAGLPAKAVFSHALDFCKGNGVGLLIIDSLGVALEGDAEASRDVIGFMRNHVDQFRAAGITTLIIDHQGKLQAGERYQNKTQFGSAYKKHLSRSVFQIEKREGTDEDRKVTFRHTKTNFGRELDPFGVKVTWGYEEITVEPDELTQADLAEEQQVPVIKRILTELEDGPKYPQELADVLGVEVGTVKNRLSTLRKAGKIEDTGEKHGQSRQVSLVSLPLRYGDGDTGIPDVLLDLDFSHF